MASKDPVPEEVDRAIALLMLKLRARDEVSDQEEAAMRAATSGIRGIDANRVVVPAGTTRSDCNLLVEGFVARYKDLPDGQRQILELHVPGDFVDLHSLLLKQLDHSVGALTPVRIAIFPHEAMRRITETQPHLARMLWLSTLIDAAIHREKILTVGRRAAVGRVAHILCELYLRLETVGLTDGLAYPLPITQTDLADATGLTSVHVNRMLKELRDDEVLTWRGGEVTIHDLDQLKRTAAYDPAYLHLDFQPR